MTDKQIIIDEINTIGYVRSALELARETLAEKDQLKEYYDKLLWRKEQECEELKRKVNDKHNLLMQYVDNYDQLKQTLAEIKEYCEEQNLKADWTACDILQKINEVEDE